MLGLKIENKLHQKKKNVPPSLFIIGALGIGGCSIIVEAEDSSTNHVYALKIIEKKRPPRRQELERLCSELVALQLPKSPFLLHAYSCFESNSHIFFLVDRIRGGDLFSHLGDLCARGADKGFSEHQACILLADVVVAIQKLHEYGLVHRDIKAENVMLDLEGRVVLIDFGFACKIGTITGHCGSLPYMAPETLGSAEDTLIKAGTKVTAGVGEDWWAFGILAHELLCGRTPWQSRDKGLRKEILTTTVVPPRRLNKQAADMITAFLNPDVTNRLGCGEDDIRQHPFFKGVDWEAVEQRKANTAITPHPACGELSQADADFVLKKYREMSTEAREAYEKGASTTKDGENVTVSDGGEWSFGVPHIDFYPDMHPRMTASQNTMFSIKTTASRAGSRAASGGSTASSSSSHGMKI
mmetsp:Transcript_9672/g.12704  ORF Transcript_9672/g.12704 Transcript_9672/m.12704 type:complete len:413 (-) Transcript_9672:177-1415(-)